MDRPQFIWSPGRINILGEHTDTSEGFCLPAAVDRGLLCAFTKTNDSLTRVVSLDIPGKVELNDQLQLSGSSASFGRYVEAVAAALAERGVRSPGLALALGSNIPKGGGMSSSAALCVALALAMIEAAGAYLEPLQVALVAQEAEHRVGVKCGLMDQYSIVHGKPGQALLLDTRTRTHLNVPLSLGGWVLVVGDTNTPRGLVDSEYNARREQVEEAARVLDGGSGEVRTLRDATSELLSEKRSILGDLLYRRAKHVIEENERTASAARLLTKQSTDEQSRAAIVELGRALDASHTSLRDQFEVSCPELDALVESLKSQGDALVPGARMMGGGFGGCVIALVEQAHLDRVLTHASGSYSEKTGKEAAFFPIAPSEGARLLDAPPSTLSSS